MKLRIGIAALLVTLLTLAGAGAAFAYWTATAGVSASASAATVGVTESAAGSSLTVSYSSTTVSASDLVTITNTSTRSGGYALALSATGTAALATAIKADIAVASTCPTTSYTGTALSSGPSYTGTTLAAGASVTLCVRTKIASTDVTANPGTSVSVTATAAIAVGPGTGAWKATAATVTFAQSIAAASASATCTTVITGTGQNKAHLAWTIPSQAQPISGNGYPEGYYIMAKSGATYYEVDYGSMWAGTTSFDLAPDRFVNFALSNGAYPIEIWYSPDIRGGSFANDSAKTLIGTTKVTFHPGGGWYSVECS